VRADRVIMNNESSWVLQEAIVAIFKKKEGGIFTGNF
jgi:hypothetical protein